MKLSMEKEYLVQNADVTELDFFKQDLKNLNYEDYCDFIADFINDTKLLFMNCNNIQFKNIMNNYNVDENLFDI